MNDAIPSAARFEEHTRSLRSLAWHLVRDEQLAEDAVQEAWLALLQSRRAPRNPAAWVAGATRNLVARTLRTRARADRRQRVAARPEAVPSGAALAEEAEILRLITTAVSELDAPYRDVIVLRFYRDEKPAAIAKTLELPLATIKTRLRRGLITLRARLGADEQSRGWMLALAPMTLAPARVAATKGVAVGAKIKVGLTLVAIGLLMVGGWMWRASAGGHDATRAGVRTGLLAAESPREKTPQTTAEAPQFVGEVNRVSVVSQDGRPAAGIPVRIAPLQDWMGATARGTTDARGICEFADLVPGTYQIFAESSEHPLVGGFAQFPGSHTLRLVGGCRLKLRLEPWPHPGWAQERWYAQSLNGSGYRPFEASGPVVDLGVWRTGLVDIGRAPRAGGTTRSIRIALPDSGEVVYTLHPGEARFAEVRVHDAETGALIRDWEVHGIDIMWERLERLPGSADGGFRVPSSFDSYFIEASGYARAYFDLRDPPSGPVRVDLRRGVSLRIEVEGAVDSVDAIIYYRGEWGFTFVHDKLPVPGVALNLSRTTSDRDEELRRLGAEEGWAADNLPPESRLEVVVRDARGLFARARIKTGEPGSSHVARVRFAPMVRRTVAVQRTDGTPVPDVLVAVRDLRINAVLGSVSTDARGRATILGLRTDRVYEIETIRNGAIEKRDLDPTTGTEEDAIVLTIAGQKLTTFRVLVLDESGAPVPGARVQFGGKPSGAAMAVAGRDGIAIGRIPSPRLAFVAVQWAPTVNGETLNDPPQDDPIVYRGNLGMLPVEVEIVGTGFAELRIKTREREQKLVCHVFGRGRARFRLLIKPGECELRATMNGETIEKRFVAREGALAPIPLVFDR